WLDAAFSDLVHHLTGRGPPRSLFTHPGSLQKLQYSLHRMHALSLRSRLESIQVSEKKVDRRASRAGISRASSACEPDPGAMARER
ncbi:MAG TPA: hypothetical protein P5144_06140, partial [Thermoanaerobaculia bacterium]|nr:hypothetical protein [Thermoanaerobaculia bacterium]